MSGRCRASASIAKPNAMRARAILRQRLSSALQHRSSSVRDQATAHHWMKIQKSEKVPKPWGSFLFEFRKPKVLCSSCDRMVRTQFALETEMRRIQREAEVRCFVEFAMPCRPARTFSFRRKGPSRFPAVSWPKRTPTNSLGCTTVCFVEITAFGPLKFGSKRVDHTRTTLDWYRLVFVINKRRSAFPAHH